MTHPEEILRSIYYELKREIHNKERRLASFISIARTLMGVLNLTIPETNELCEKIHAELQ